MKALIAVDIQNDFCPGGALAVPEGDRVIPVINRLAEKFDHTRSSMGAALIGAALVDAWDVAGLPSPYEPGTELHERFLAYFKEDEE